MQTSQGSGLGLGLGSGLGLGLGLAFTWFERGGAEAYEPSLRVTLGTEPAALAQAGEGQG